MNHPLLTDGELLALATRLRPDRDPRDVLAHVIWGTITEPGDAVGGALRAELGAADAADFALAPGGIGVVPSRALGEARARWRPRATKGLISATALGALHNGHALLLPGDPVWPEALADLGVHAPALLWARGDAGVLHRAGRAVSIVGARASTPYGEQMARELAGDLAVAGHPIISGGAYGIDGAAHRAALGVGGTTIAFVAGGADRIYPAGHATLLGDIADAGLLLSEVPAGSPPTKWRFLGRNRLIAALGRATVVVEAGSRSGTLNTAGHASSLGRPLGAVPGPVTSAASAGCHRLLREYDARCITGADDVRELLGETGMPVPEPIPYEHDRLRLGDALSTRTPRDPHELARRSGLSVAEVEALLGLLALEGVVQRDGDGWRQTA